MNRPKGSLVSDFRLTRLGINQSRAILETDIIPRQPGDPEAVRIIQIDDPQNPRTRGFAPRLLKRFAFVWEQG